MALPFDAATLAATGEAQTIAENVEVAAHNMLWRVFFRRRVVLWPTRMEVSNNRELVWMDRTGKRVGVLWASRIIYSTFSISPDEKTIAATVGIYGQG